MTSEPFISRVYLFEPDTTLFELLKEARPELEILDAPTGAEVRPPQDAPPYAIISFAPGERINAFRDVKWIHCGGAGYDKIEAALDFGPPVVTRTIGRLGDQLAEYVVAYFLHHTQKMRLRRSLQRERSWEPKPAAAIHAFDQRAIVFGTGPMGASISQYLSRLDIETIGVSRSGTPKDAFDKVVTLDGLAEADPQGAALVVLALPDNEATRGLIDGAVLGQFRETLLINVGRGTAVPEPALFEAIDKRHVAHAVLDVTPTEPLPPDSPLWAHPRITVTPHVSGGTRPEDIAAAFLDSLAALEAGRTPPNPVDLG